MDNALYFPLLSRWCEALLSLQVKETGNAKLDGGILCPSCQLIHGRCDNAIYPFMTMAERTGDPKWVKAACALFDWHTSMLCDDGSVYNDSNSNWRFITVFSAIGLCEALEKHGHLLDAETKKRWDARLMGFAQWLYDNLDENAPTNINYNTTNACALALTGNYLHREDYLARAHRLAWFALDHISENGLLYGEGVPYRGLSEKGCRPIDIGYDVEESIPALVKYALATDDAPALEKLRWILDSQLSLLLPDGGWDNSFGSRNNKWTYWGSRTSDGMQGAYALLAKTNPVYNTAALRNTELLARCTHETEGLNGGLLYGGPEYHKYDAPPCSHHTFCHANAIAAALDAGIESASDFAPLPELPKCKYYPELDVTLAQIGTYRATVTGYDWDVLAGHASGGTLSLLWHEKVGPMLLASVYQYRLAEPLNQQMPRNLSMHRSLSPRAEVTVNGTVLSNIYDTTAAITRKETAEGLEILVETQLVYEPERGPGKDFRHYIPRPPMAPALHLSLRYELQPDGATIQGRFGGAGDRQPRFVLPVIAGEYTLLAGREAREPERIFFLTGGFGAMEHVILPDENGAFEIRLKA